MARSASLLASWRRDPRDRSSQAGGAICAIADREHGRSPPAEERIFRPMANGFVQLVYRHRPDTRLHAWARQKKRASTCWLGQLREVISCFYCPHLKCALCLAVRALGSVARAVRRCAAV